MALTYNASATAWWKQPKADRDQEWPVVQAIILFSMVLGISSITKENVNDVLARIRFYEKLNGGFLTSGGKDCNIPASIVRSLIGLTTNVRPETWASYSRRIVKNWFAEQTRSTLQGRLLDLENRYHDSDKETQRRLETEELELATLAGWSAVA